MRQECDCGDRPSVTVFEENVTEGLYPQPQSSLLALGAHSPLVSVDSFGSLPASQDSPLGYRFPHSPL